MILLIYHTGSTFIKSGVGLCTPLVILKLYCVNNTVSIAIDLFPALVAQVRRTLTVVQVPAPLVATQTMKVVVRRRKS